MLEDHLTANTLASDKKVLHAELYADTQKIKILYVIPSLQMGGAEMQLLSLLDGLDKKRFAATVAVLYEKGELRREFEAIPGIDVVYLGKKSPLHFGFLIRLLVLCKRQSFDIISAYNVSARLWAMVVAKLTGVRNTVMTERNSSAVYSSMGSRVYHALERIVLRHARLVITNSRAGLIFLRDCGVSDLKIRVIFNGIKADRLKPLKSPQEIRREWKVPDASPLVGMVARMFPQKDHHTFLQSAALVSREMPEVRFMLVGDGPVFNDVKSDAASLGLDRVVIFTGFQNRAIDFINAMDVVVLTSEKSEGHSNALIEAMLLSKAVIATDVPGNNELIRDQVTGILVPAKHPEQLAEKIIELLGNAQRRFELGKEARAMSLRIFSQQQMVREHEGVYESLFRY